MTTPNIPKPSVQPSQRKPWTTWWPNSTKSWVGNAKKITSVPFLHDQSKTFYTYLNQFIIIAPIIANRYLIYFKYWLSKNEYHEKKDDNFKNYFYQIIYNLLCFVWRTLRPLCTDTYIFIFYCKFYSPPRLLKASLSFISRVLSLTLSPLQLSIIYNKDRSLFIARLQLLIFNISRLWDFPISWPRPLKLEIGQWDRSSVLIRQVLEAKQPARASIPLLVSLFDDKSKWVIFVQALFKFVMFAMRISSFIWQLLRLRAKERSPSWLFERRRKLLKVSASSLLLEKSMSSNLWKCS